MNSITVEWGKITDNKNSKIYKDAICISGKKIIEWDWTKHDIHHDPGYTIQLIQEYIKKYNPKIIILSKGFHNKLLVKKYIMEYIIKIGLDYFVLNTEDAVKIYNYIVSKGDNVVLFCHSTC